MCIRDREAVAIKTNVGRLIDSLNLHEFTSYAGAVKYEPSADFVMENMVELAYLKRPAFNYEREFRLCYIDLAVNETEGELSLATDTNCLSPGQPIPVSLPEIIECVKIGPGCPAWVSELVFETAARFAPDIEIEPSDLHAPPEWNVKGTPSIMVQAEDIERQESLISRPRNA